MERFSRARGCAEVDARTEGDGTDGGPVVSAAIAETRDESPHHTGEESDHKSSEKHDDAVMDEEEGDAYGHSERSTTCDPEQEVLADNEVPPLQTAQQLGEVVTREVPTGARCGTSLCRSS
ncbi:hypothetical protein HEK616_35740 [Streptomyces nigrescens]|uniref:Uncharacterized protein n=1 Tax=Streptomyces nigrescens TaxID=1920 RepID=A0ABN6QV84_STRNI|nr:hypothetical protein HEK616_35740 [Streptomyces nigrescens]